MGKSWDTLDWKMGTGFSDPGIGERTTPWPSYGGTQFGGANPTCQTCGGRLRGLKKCECDEPDWVVDGESVDDETGRVQNIENIHAQQEWHLAWLKETFRVLRNGGVIKAFGGTRTFHRLAMAMQEAGFVDIHLDAWIHGQGFPKSHNIGKAIDKRGGFPHLTVEVSKAIKAAREKRGLTVGECDRKFCGGTTYWTWFEGRSAGINLPPPDIFSAIAAEWPELQPLAEQIAQADRDVLGKTEATYGYQRDGDRWDKDHFITAPSTEAAKKFSGYGTALKPAWEVFLVGRKP